MFLGYRFTCITNYCLARFYDDFPSIGKDARDAPSEFSELDFDIDAHRPKPPLFQLIECANIAV
jgi:hypothetical protein